MSNIETTKWLRFFQLTVATDSENKEAIDLSEYRVKFRISQGFVGKPTTADIFVYNVAPETMAKIKVPQNKKVQKEHIKVIIDAGYQEDHAIIFQGDLWWKSTGRENETDTFLRLIASSGDRAHQYAVVNASIPRGFQQADIFKAISKSMKDFGVKEIAVPVEKTDPCKAPRGKVLYMLSERAMQNLCDTNNFFWGYTNDGIVAMPKQPTYDPNTEAVVLTPETGLIGRPKITVDGIEVQCLLDHRLKIGSMVRIENSRLQRDPYSTDYKADVMTLAASTEEMEDKNGLYRVIFREFQGDTRGTEWYANIRCQGLNATVKPLSPEIIRTIKD